MDTIDWESLIDWDSFWRTVELARTDHAAYTQELARMSRRQRVLFAWAFEDAISTLIRAREAGFAAELQGSEDSMDDHARKLVSRGRAAYDIVLAGGDTGALASDSTRASWEAQDVFERLFGDLLPPIGYDLPT